jgi:hypothetical protein
VNRSREGRGCVFRVLAASGMDPDDAGLVGVGPGAAVPEEALIPGTVDGPAPQTMRPTPPTNTKFSRSGTAKGNDIATVNDAIRISSDEARSASRADRDDGDGPPWLVAVLKRFPQFTADEVVGIRHLFEEHAKDVEVGKGWETATLGRTELGVIMTESLRTFFDDVDQDGNGTLDRAEIARLVGKLDRPMSADELDALMEQLDADQDNCISFEGNRLEA